MPSTHPFVMFLGVIGMTFLTAVTALGLTCSVYNTAPDYHKDLQIYQEWAKSVKLC